MDTQHYYTCPSPECPVVVFVDRMAGSGVDPAMNGTCPGDIHDLEDRGTIIEKTF